MSKKTYTEISNEELQKNIKSTTLITGVLGGALVALVLLNIFVNKKNFWGIIAVPLCFSPIVFMNYNNIKEMKKELKNRNNSY